MLELDLGLSKEDLTFQFPAQSEVARVDKRDSVLYLKTDIFVGVHAGLKLDEISYALKVMTVNNDLGAKSSEL